MNVIATLSILIAVVCGITINERNELSRKFKYYYASVRSTAPENFISNRNGTFFNIDTEVHLLGTFPRAAQRLFRVEAVVQFTWIDDRLALRDLRDRIEMPSEFIPWLPRARTSPDPYIYSTFLTPSTGVITWYHRINGEASCSVETWKHPFETLYCELSIENIGNEILTITAIRDLRPDSHASVEFTKALFPLTGVHFHFANEWHSAVLSVFLPSILVLALVFFAQWKRRKVQVLVSTAALVCLLIMLSSGARSQPGVNMLDLWLSGCFLHAAFLLAVDLILPARRVRYSLTLPVNGVDRSEIQILTKAKEKKSKYIPEFLRRLSLKAKDESYASSELVTACPGNSPIQRQVTHATLGERKRFALFAVGASFVVFMLIYLLLISTID